jgi:DNA-binding response OmpR family regulator
MKVLVVEDSTRLRTYVTRALKRYGYVVDPARDGEEALSRLHGADYDVVVLDLMLPKLDGMEVLRWLRQREKDARVLILTARDHVDDRVCGLQSGADDYLVKPFALSELEARIGVLVRRHYGCKSPQISLDGLVIDTARRVVHRDGTMISLQPKEYALLEYLVMRRGRIVTRNAIEGHVYDDAADLRSNFVEVAICRLRQKIDVAGRPSIIETRRGVGYTLREVGS